MAEEIAHKISSDSLCGDAIAIKCDVSREDQVQSLFKQAIDHFGTIDICVPNAGLQKDSSLHDMKLEDWHLPRIRPIEGALQ